MKSILDSERVTNKQVDYEELIQTIFFKNKSDRKRIIINASLLNSQKDLFYFALDLFCKGLVYVYGGDNKSIVLDALSMEDIQNVIDLLSYTGIMTIIRIISADLPTIEPPKTSSEIYGMTDDPFMLSDDECEQDDAIAKHEQSSYNVIHNSLETLSNSHTSCDLSEYNFQLKVKDMIYVIQFDVQY
jgi:hypothetical protein